MKMRHVRLASFMEDKVEAVCRPCLPPDARVAAAKYASRPQRLFANRTGVWRRCWYQSALR